MTEKNLKPCPFQPTREMLDTAREWSRKKYGQAIGVEGITECWQAMHGAAQLEAVEGLPTKMYVGDSRNPFRHPTMHDGYCNGWNAAINACQAYAAGLVSERDAANQALFQMQEAAKALLAANTKMADCLKTLRSPMADLPHWRDGVDLIDEALAANGERP